MGKKEKAEFKGAFFQSHMAGKFDHVLFEKVDDIEFVEVEAHAEELRNHHFFKRGVLVELTEPQVKKAKEEKEKGKKNSDAEFNAAVESEVKKRMSALGEKKGSGEPEHDVDAIKAYLDKHDIKYHHALGAEKLAKLMVDHQTGN